MLGPVIIYPPKRWYSHIHKAHCWCSWTARWNAKGRIHGTQAVHLLLPGPWQDAELVDFFLGTLTWVCSCEFLGTNTSLPPRTSSSGLLSRFCPPSPQLFLFYASCFPAFPIALDMWMIQCLRVWLDFGFLLSWAREVHGHPLKQLVLLATPVSSNKRFLESKSKRSGDQAKRTSRQHC